MAARFPEVNFSEFLSQAAHESAASKVEAKIRLSAQAEADRTAKLLNAADSSTVKSVLGAQASSNLLGNNATLIQAKALLEQAAITDKANRIAADAHLATRRRELASAKAAHEAKLAAAADKATAAQKLSRQQQSEANANMSSRFDQGVKEITPVSLQEAAGAKVLADYIHGPKEAVLLATGVGVFGAVTASGLKGDSVDPYLAEVNAMLPAEGTPAHSSADINASKGTVETKGVGTTRATGSREGRKLSAEELAQLGYAPDRIVYTNLPINDPSFHNKGDTGGTFNVGSFDPIGNNPANWGAGSRAGAHDVISSYDGSINGNSSVVDNSPRGVMNQVDRQLESYNKDYAATVQSSIDSLKAAPGYVQLKSDYTIAVQDAANGVEGAAAFVLKAERDLANIDTANYNRAVAQAGGNAELKSRGSELAIKQSMAVKALQEQTKTEGVLASHGPEVRAIADMYDMPIAQAVSLIQDPVSRKESLPLIAAMRKNGMRPLPLNEPLTGTTRQLNLNMVRNAATGDSQTKADQAVLLSAVGVQAAADTQAQVSAALLTNPTYGGLTTKQKTDAQIAEYRAAYPKIFNDIARAGFTKSFLTEGAGRYRTAMTRSVTKAGGINTKVFMQNIPDNASPEDVLAYLEGSVVPATMEAYAATSLPSMVGLTPGTLTTSLSALIRAYRMKAEEPSYVKGAREQLASIMDNPFGGAR